MPFQLVPKSTTLNGCTALYCTNDASFRAHCKNLKQDRPIPLTAKNVAQRLYFHTV